MAGVLQGPDEVTGDDMLVAMDAVGFDAALLVSPFSMYWYDPAYVLEVHAKHPGWFGLIEPFDPASASVADEIAEWARTPGVVGAYLMLTGQSYEPDDPGIDRILTVGAQAGIPMNVMCWGSLPFFNELARSHPETRMVIDHVGMIQPFVPPSIPEPFADLATVVSLASYDNVVIKISGACTLSLQPFPYPDIWEPLGKVFQAFGFDRCMWGTDWTRTVEFLSYEQRVDAFRIMD